MLLSTVRNWLLNERKEVWHALHLIACHRPPIPVLVLLLLADFDCLLLLTLHWLCHRYHRQLVAMSSCRLVFNQFLRLIRHDCWVLKVQIKWTTNNTSLRLSFKRLDIGLLLLNKSLVTSNLWLHVYIFYLTLWLF